MPEPRKLERLSWPVFAAMAVIGMAIAVFVFMSLGMSECLPRDGSEAMRACDVEKRREFWLYPALVIAMITGATWLQIKGWRMGRIVALTSGLAGALVLWLIENLIA